MLPEKGCKPLKASQKIPKSRCIDLESRDRCSVTRKDHTSLLITKMAKDFKNKIMATKCVFSDLKGQCWEWSRKDLQLYLSLD
jgi:hypothetical protein